MKFGHYLSSLYFTGISVQHKSTSITGQIRGWALAQSIASILWNGSVPRHCGCTQPVAFNSRGSAKDYKAVNKV